MILPRSGKISGSHVPVAVQISFSHAIPIQQPKLLDHLNIVLFIMETMRNYSLIANVMRNIKMRLLKRVNK
jgi:hypothetical protein